MTTRWAMTALATIWLTVPATAQDCGGDFSAWRDRLAEEARAAGVGEKGLDALASARIDERVLKRDRAQGVFSQTFTEFAGRMISEYRLVQGERNLERFAEVFAEAESRFGAPGPVIAAFWALETDFGANQGDFRTLDALVTLAHDCRRPEIFRPHLVPLLTLIDRGVLPADVEGAWAGEIGQTQMLPRDILRLGQDGDGDGVADIRNSEPDVILTTAAKLQARGWRAGEPWLEEVTLSSDLPWEETGRANRLPVAQWTAWGVTARDGAPLEDRGVPAGLVLPQGHRGPAFLAYPNFDVYLEWNQSFVYTLTAAHLAARLAGAPPFDPRSPEPGLDLEAMKRLQEKLVARGHDVGGVDGILGVATREAVRQEQMRLGFVVDGWPTRALLEAL